MRYLKTIISFLIFFPALMSSAEAFASGDIQIPPSTKKERNHITKGNEFYNKGNYKEAVKEYQEALEENSASQVARYNLGMAEIAIGSNPSDTTDTAKKMLAEGVKNMQQIANLGTSRPDLAAKANYNLGNVSFFSEDYARAIDYYKKSLRLDPQDEYARRNLRIAQLKLKNQEQNQDQDQQQQDQQNQDQQDQEDQNDNEEQQQEQNQDQQNQQNQEQEQQQDQNSINQQTAEQIMNAIENKENQTRARLGGQEADKAALRNKNKRNW